MVSDIFELFRGVREHPDFAFGTIFVKDDFPDGKVPDDFSKNLGTDQLAQAGNEYIEMTVGLLDEEDEGTFSSSTIFRMFDSVREHPDYVFGTIFVPGDFPGGKVPDDFMSNRADDRLAEEGAMFIELTAGFDED